MPYHENMSKTLQNNPKNITRTLLQAKPASLSKTERARQIIFTSLGTIGANTFLAGLKFVIGFASHSQAVLSDAANNLGDALGSFVTIIGTRLSTRKPDRRHPFGYGRIEYITSAIVAALVLYVGIETLISSIQALIEPQPVSFTSLSLWLLAAGLVLKLSLGLWLKARGKKLKAVSIEASAADSLSDSILSLATLISALLSRFAHIQLGGWLGLVISFFIIKSAIELLISPLNELVGLRTDEVLGEEIKNSILSADPQVQGVYDLILNTYGDSLSIGSVHIQVSDTLNTRQIQALTRRITKMLYKTYHLVMTIGIYASNDSDPQSARIRKLVEQTLQSYPQIVQMHGFYVDLNLDTVAFDLIFDYQSDGAALRKEIRDRLQKELPGYTIDIVVDGDYTE